MSSERPRPQPAPEFAGAIREARQRAGLSAGELASRAGIEPSTYEEIERGERPPELEAIVQLAGALGVTAAELLERAGL